MARKTRKRLPLSDGEGHEVELAGPDGMVNEPVPRSDTELLDWLLQAEHNEWGNVIGRGELRRIADHVRKEREARQ